jgi:hypothetical protein
MDNVFEQQIDGQEPHFENLRRGFAVSDAFNRRHFVEFNGHHSIGRKPFDNASLAMVFPDVTSVR